MRPETESWWRREDYRVDRTTTLNPALTRFAKRLNEEIGATRVLLFGSYARGNAYYDSDYDFIVVSPRFEGVDSFHRGRDLRDIWTKVGGYGPMDIVCLKPQEFDCASTHITLVNSVLPEAIDLLPVEAPVA